MLRRSFLALAASPAARAVAPTKITKLTTHKFTLSNRDHLILRIHTDSGLIGFGEGSLPGRVDIVEQAIRWLEPYLINQDPGGIEDHWNRLYYEVSRWRDGSVMNTALAAVDIALWDLEGKRLGLPVWRLLGARRAKPLRVYYSHWSQEVSPRTPAALADLARRTRAAGWTAVKWIAFRGGSEIERLRRIVAEVEAVRLAAPDLDIALELAETFTIRSTIDLARALLRIACCSSKSPLGVRVRKAWARSPPRVRSRLLPVRAWCRVTSSARCSSTRARASCSLM